MLMMKNARSDLECIAQCLPHRLNFAVIDEADSVLIDESLNPMIISTRIEQDERPIRLVDEAVGSLYREIMDQVDQVRWLSY